jgi:hypothetical protein
MDHGSMNMPHTSMDMMRPYLFSSKTGYYLLFKQAFVTTGGGFAGALFATLAFAALTSVVFFLSQRIEREASSKHSQKVTTPRLLISAGAHAGRWFMH